VEFPDLPPLGSRPAPEPPAAKPAAAALPAVAASVPAAAQAITIPKVSPATAASFQAFESICGGREALVTKLSLVASSKDEDYVVGLLADPRYDRESLASLCRIGKVSLQRLMSLYRDAALVSAQVGAIDRVATGLPAVAADVMTRAIEHRVTCPICQGLTTITPAPTKDKPNPTPEPCRACGGFGSTVAQPEHEVQKTALELGGLLKKGGGGLTIQQNNTQVALAGGAAGFDEMIEKLDEVLFGTARDRVKVKEQTTYVEAESVTQVPGAEDDAAPPANPPAPTAGEGAPPA
jgi:hypothetical protein